MWCVACLDSLSSFACAVHEKGGRGGEGGGKDSNEPAPTVSLVAVVSRTTFTPVLLVSILCISVWPFSHQLFFVLLSLLLVERETCFHCAFEWSVKSVTNQDDRFLVFVQLQFEIVVVAVVVELVKKAMALMMNAISSRSRLISNNSSASLHQCSRLVHLPSDRRV